MKMKNSFKLAVAISSALAITSGASYAFDLGEETSPDTYAEEINYDTDNGGPLPINYTAGGEDITLADGLGFGVAIGEKVYVRVDLANATYQTAPALEVGTASAPAAAGAADAVEVVVDGGTEESTCVVFEVTAGVAPLAQDGTVEFTPDTINVLDNTQPVTATYNLFSSAANAACFKPAPVTAELTATVDGGIVEMGPSFELDVVEAPTTIAQVTSLYTTTDEDNSDAGNTAEPIIVLLSTVELGLTGTLNANSGGVVAGDLDAGNELTVAGDFTAANLAAGDETVRLEVGGGGGNGCDGSGAIIDADLTDPQSATFSPLVVDQVYNLCYGMLDADTDDASDNPILESTYSASVDITPVGAANILAIPSADAGEIDRNGAVLRVPFFSKHADSNYVSLANMGSTDAVYTTTCYSKVAGNDPIVGLVEQPIAAQRTKNLFFSHMCPGFGPGFYDAIEITVTTASGNVVGSLVRVDSATGKAEYSYITNNEHGE